MNELSLYFRGRKPRGKCCIPSLLAPNRTEDPKNIETSLRQTGFLPKIILILVIIALYGITVMPVSGWNTPGCKESVSPGGTLSTCTPQLGEWSIGYKQEESIAAGDVNGDGKDEIIYGDVDDKIQIFRMDGAKLIEWPLDYAGWDGLAIGDVDSDGNAEIIHGDRDNMIHIFRINGDKVEKIKEWPLDYKQEESITAGDVNGDGKDEIIFGDTDDTIQIFNMDGTKIKQWSLDYESWDGLAAGDVDGDGRAEIIHGDRGDKIRVFRMDKTKVAELSLDFAQEDGLAVGDVDGDGKDEIIHGDSDSDMIHIFRINGDKVDKIKEWPLDFDNWDGLAVGDVNGDGKAEIIQGDRDDRIWIYEMNGTKLPLGKYDQRPHIYTVQYAIDYFRETGKTNWADYLEKKENFRALASGLTFADYYKGRAKLYLKNCILTFICWKGDEKKDLGPYAAYDHYYDPIGNHGLQLEWTSALKAELNLYASTAIYGGTAGIYYPDLMTVPDIVGKSYPPANKVAEEHYQKALDLIAKGDNSGALFEAGHSLHLLQDTSFYAHLMPDNIKLFLSHGAIEDLGDGLGYSGVCSDCHITAEKTLPESIPDYQKPVSQLSHEAAVETLDEYAGLTSANHLTVVKKEIYRTERYTVAFFTKLLTDMNIPTSLNTPPRADFTLSNSSGAAPLLLEIKDSSTGNPTTWSWTFSGPIGAGSGPIKSRILPVYGLGEPGIVTITLTVSNAYGSSSKTKTVTVTGDIPIADFTVSNESGPPPLKVQFTDTSKGIVSNWSWTLSGPSFGGDTGPFYTRGPLKYELNKPGINTITFTVSNALGSSTKTKTVTVTGIPPVADFSLSSEYGPAPMYLVISDRSTGNPTNWSWTFGGTPFGAGPGPIYRQYLPTYGLGPGTFTITLTVSNEFGSSSKTKTVTVTGDIPVADFTVSSESGPAPLSVKFTDASTGYITSRVWMYTLPDGTSSGPINSETLPPYLFTQPGVVTMTLKVSNAYGESSKTRTITVLPSDTTCSAGTECLLESEAIKKFGDLSHVPFRSSSTSCGTSGGSSKYCYFQGVLHCPTGTECMASEMAEYLFVEPKIYSTSVCAYANAESGSGKIPFYCYYEGSSPAPKDPAVTGISPSSINRNTAVMATISGANFASGAEVKVESLGYEVQATGEQTISSNQIRCTLNIPQDGLTGYYNVYVRNPGGSWVYGHNLLQVTGGATHIVTGISPTSYEAGSTFTAAVYGKNFPPEAEVAIQHESDNTWYYATNEQYLSKTEIRCTFTIPQNAPRGPYNVYVKNPVTGWVYLRNGFTVYFVS